MNAPGDVVTYTVQAWDQVNNTRDGIWRIEDCELEDVCLYMTYFVIFTQQSEKKHTQLFEYFSIPAGPKNHIETFGNVQQDTCERASQQQALRLTRHTQEREFFIIQAVTEDVVSMDLQCISYELIKYMHICADKV